MVEAPGTAESPQKVLLQGFERFGVEGSRFLSEYWTRNHGSSCCRCHRSRERSALFFMLILLDVTSFQHSSEFREACSLKRT